MNKRSAKVAGSKLMDLRRERFNSQQELADAAGLSLNVVCNAENSKTIRISSLRQIAKVFGLRWEDLVFREQQEPSVDERMDVLIPVGPLEADEKKMNEPGFDGLPVGGIKLLAVVTNKEGKKQPVLYHVLDCLRRIETRVRNIHLLTVLKGNEDLWTRLQRSINQVPSSNPFRRRIYPVRGNGDKITGLTKGFEDITDSITPLVLLHYSDVWPDDTSFYDDLLDSVDQRMSTQTLEASYDDNDKIYGGVFGCATQVPSNFLRDPEKIKVELAGRPLVRWVSQVEKPFHRVSVQFTKPGSQGYVYLTNMAIAIVSKRVLADLGKGVGGMEFFEGIKAFSNYYFDVCPYFGSWLHVDNNEDVKLINASQTRQQELSND